MAILWPSNTSTCFKSWLMPIQATLKLMQMSIEYMTPVTRDNKLALERSGQQASIARCEKSGSRGNPPTKFNGWIHGQGCRDWDDEGGIGCIYSEDRPSPNDVQLVKGADDREAAASWRAADIGHRGNAIGGERSKRIGVRRE